MSRHLLALIALAFALFAHAADHNVPADFPTIQAAIDAAQPGDTITIAAGSYPENLTLKSGISLRGVGPSGEQRTNIAGSIQTGPIISCKDAPGVTLTGLRISCAEGKNTKNENDPPPLIDMNGGTLALENCAIENAPGRGLVVVDGTATAKQCSFSSCRFSGALSKDKGELVCEDCTFDRNERAGAAVTDGASLRVVRCGATGNQNGFVASESRFEATDTTAQSNSLFGIEAYRCSLLQIVNSKAMTNTGHGIHITRAPESTRITGNTCSGNKDMGIVLMRGSKGLIEGNTCSNNTNTGIEIQNAGTNVTVRNNHCEGNEDYGIVLWHGVTGDVSKNECVNNGIGGIEIYGWDCTPDVLENSCQGNENNGIEIGAYAAPHVHGNTCAGSHGHGIAVLDSSAKPTIEDNTLADNTAGEIDTSTTPPASIEFDYYAPVVSLLNGEFDYLENLHKKMTEGEPRVENGYYWLADYYNSMSYKWEDYGELTSKEFPKDWFAAIDKWEAAYPNSPTPHIARAKLLNNLGWSARGSGWANEITKDGAKTFHDNCTKADLELDKAETFGGSNDAVLYEVRLEICRALNKPNNQSRTALEAGLKADPGYAPMYESYLTSQVERWGGSDEKVRDFLREIPKLGGAGAGDVYCWSIDEIAKYEGCDAVLSKKFDIDYAYAKPALDSFLTRFPDVNQFHGLLALLASMAADQPTAKAEFARLKSVPRDEALWTKENYDLFEAWADGKTPYPDVEKLEAISASGKRHLKPILSLDNVVVEVAVVIGGTVVILCLLLFAITLWLVNRQDKGRRPNNP